MRQMGMRGITLMELIIVIAVSGTIMGIAAFNGQRLLTRCEAENQVRRMHVDMMDARVRALQASKVFFVTVTAEGYQITEDTNESGGTEPDAEDTALWAAPKRFKHHSQWTGTVIMDAKGIISTSAHPLLSNAALAIRFDAVDADPEYDCILVGPTRMNAGKWNGRKCVQI